MTPEQHLYETLRDNAGVAAIVGGRIYPDQSAEDVPLPAIVYARVGTAASQYGLNGALLAEKVALEVHCFEWGREGAEALATAVLSAVHSRGYEMRNRTADRSDATGEDSGIDITILSLERWDCR